MKVYFAGSIRGGRDDRELYKEIIDYINSIDGCAVLTEHIGLKSATAMGEAGKSDEQIYERDMAWLHETDVVIAEVTTPSLGVGYEIAKAEEWGKPILAIARTDGTRPVSAMITGSPKIQTKQYTNLAEAKVIIQNFLS